MSEKMLVTLCHLLAVDETHKRANYIARMISRSKHLSVLATEEPDQDETAHNSPEERYVPVADDRIPGARLLLRPVTTQGKYVGDIVTLATTNLTEEIADRFTSIYRKRARTSFKTLLAFLLVFAIRHVNGAIRNGATRQLKLQAENEDMIELFSTMPEAQWEIAKLTILRTKKAEDAEVLLDLIEERRS